jgi:hypothetical protein
MKSCFTQASELPSYHNQCMMSDSKIHNDQSSLQINRFKLYSWPFGYFFTCAEPVEVSRKK